MVYLTNLNLNKNELMNAVIQPLAAPPDNPRLGQIYTDSVTKKIMTYDGHTWKPAGQVIEGSEKNGLIVLDGVETTIYTLPTASQSVAGGVKVGDNLSVDENGIMSSVDTKVSNVPSNPAKVITGISGGTTPSTTNVKDLKLDGISPVSGGSVEEGATVGDAIVSLDAAVKNAVSGSGEENQFAFSHVQVGIGVANADSKTDTIKLIADENISMSVSGKSVTIKGDYKDATSSSHGLMSANDKSKISSIAEGATKTENSSENGKIKINGVETVVYTHPTKASSVPSLVKVGSDGYGHVIIGEEISTEDISSIGVAPIESPVLTGCPEAPTAATGTNTTQIATTEYVQDAISGFSSAVQFKGTVNSQSDILLLPDYKSKWCWIVGTQGTIVGTECEVGDWIYCIADKKSTYSDGDFSVVQGNLTNTVTSASALTNNAIVIGNGSRGVKTSSTIIGTSVSNSDTAVPTSKAVVNYAQPISTNLSAISSISGTGIVKRVGTGMTGWSAGGSITNSELSTMGPKTIKGNNGSESTTPADLTVEQVISMLGMPKKYTAVNQTIGQSGGLFSWLIPASTHKIGNNAINVQLYEVSSGEQVLCDVTINQSTFDITISICEGSVSSLSAGKYRVVAIG